MNSFEFNKIAGAVLGTALLVFGLNELSSSIFSHHKPEKAGFLVEVAEAQAAQGGDKAAEAVPLPALLAKADVAKGQAGAKACMACHTFEKGGPNKTGPALWDIVDRNGAAAAGFAYSEGLAARSGEKWTYEALDAFLKAPKAYVKGTKMSFGGIKNDAKRADLLAYLASLSDAPKPFPKP